jgi:hypothetical protein
LTWTSAEEWAPGPGVGGSGGGGELFYLNDSTAPDAPTTNIPTGASGETVKELGTVAAAASTTVLSTASVPVLPAAPELIIGFVTDLNVPGVTSIPAGLWEFNVWAEATGNTTNQSYIQAKVYKYDGVNAPTAIATSAEVYLYDPRDVTQYTLSVLIPGGVTLLATDRIYVEILGGSTTSNRRITLSFGNSTPSHVHTTLFVLINLGTDVTGTLPVANGGTGVTSASANTVFAGPTSGSAAAPAFRSLVANDIPNLSATYLTVSTAASTYLTQSNAASTYLTQTNAASTYLTQTNAASTYLTQTNAASTYLTQTNAASTYQTIVGQPYDLPCEIPGTPPTSTKVVNFKAVRAFNLAATGHQGGQLTPPSGNFVCTVAKNGTSIGTITFASGGFSHSITATSFAAGDVLSVETQSTDLGIDTPFFTLAMTLA